VRIGIPFHPRRSCLVHLLYVAISQPNGNVAKFPKPPTLGRIRGEHLFHSICVVFWFVGLIPDLATLRDRATGPIRTKNLRCSCHLGWRGGNQQWRHYEKAYLILAGISTPLVLSVHSVVSFDFAVSVIPGWHTTILPPYFVAGAIFSGFAMVLTLMIPIRKLYNLQNIITMGHLDKICKILLATV
jgi:Ni/Fe-hydrogenase subunit HybB-like protein